MNVLKYDKKLPVTLLLRVFLRSFLLQASWNFERMQNLGFLYVAAPVLRFLHKDEELKRSFERHLDYFNTHPFLASPVVGSVLRFEEDRANDRDLPVEIHDLKTMTMAPYAAIGDALFWGGIRPLAAGVALFFAAKESLWAPVVFLALFNLPHLWFRSFGLFMGYFRGLAIAETIQRRRLPDIAIRLKEGTVILLGALCAYLVYMGLKGADATAGWGMVVLPFILFAGFLTRRGVSTLLIVLLASTFSIALLHMF